MKKILLAVASEVREKTTHCHLHQREIMTYIFRQHKCGGRPGIEEQS